MTTTLSNTGPRTEGVHHVGLTVPDLVAALSQRDDVQIEFDPEPLGGGNARHMMCRIPGNIRLELIVPASRRI